MAGHTFTTGIFANSPQQTHAVNTALGARLSVILRWLLIRKRASSTPGLSEQQNLRARLARATSSRGLKIATYSASEGLYMWKRTKRTERSKACSRVQRFT